MGEPSSSSVSDYYQVCFRSDNLFVLQNRNVKAPTKSKYAAKMEYINKKNEIDTAKTHLYKNMSKIYKTGYVTCWQLYS